MIQLKTKRLRIVALDNEHLSQWIELEENEHTKAVLEQMLSNCLEHPGNEKWHTNWQILLRENDQAIGCISFKGEPENGLVEIGYGLEEEYRRMGYGYEAIKDVLTWAFDQKDVYFIVAETEPDNLASQALLKKLGFTRREDSNFFEKEKPQSMWMPIFLSMGLCLGLSFSNALDKEIGIGMCLGMCFGLCIGLGLDASDRATREKLKKARNKKDQ